MPSKQTELQFGEPLDSVSAADTRSSVATTRCPAWLDIAGGRLPFSYGNDLLDTKLFKGSFRFALGRWDTNK